MTPIESTDALTLGDGVPATSVERPDDRHRLAEVVGRLAADGAALYPQGGRTALEAGGPPDRPGVAIDLLGLDRIVDYPAADMTVTVEAGATLGALRSVLLAEGQRLPIEAPTADRATIGGIYATDTSGPRRLGLGRPRDQILGIAFATSAGAIVNGGGRVVKNVAGYDFPKLLTGSMGSFGVLVELTLKTRPIPEATGLLWTSWPGIDAIGPVLDLLNTSKTRPAAIELLNVAAAEAIARTAGLDVPSGASALVVGVEGASEVVDWQLETLARELESASGREMIREGAADRLWEALADFQAGEAAITFKANLRPSALAEFAEAVDPGRWMLQCHAGNGIAWGVARSGVPIDDLAPDIGRLRELAVAADGNLTLPRCPSAMKGTLGVWGAPRGDWDLARAIKRALDPLGAMNPGRFL